ncbi:Hypothetical predicted protein, partial [Pelobates cultripes]
MAVPSNASDSVTEPSTLRAIYNLQRLGYSRAAAKSSFQVRHGLHVGPTGGS